MFKLRPALVLVTVLAALASCGLSAEFEAAVASCEQAVREEAENPRSVSFGEILHGHVKEWPEPNSWDIYGAFTQTAGDRVLVPHFYDCTFSEGEITALRLLSGHAADYDKAASRPICLEAIAQQSEDTSRAYFRSDMPASGWGALPYWVFLGTVDLMNASGAFIRYRYTCEVDHGEIRELTLFEKK